MVKSKFLLVFICTVSFATTCLVAQKNTNSVYSRFGLGDIYQEGFAQNNSLGGLGIGLRVPNKINLINPASLSSQDSLSFLFDFGTKGRSTKYEAGNASETFHTFNVDHMAISFPVTKWLKTGVWLRPFSAVGYSVVDTVNTATESIKKEFEGTGGLNQVGMATSINFLDHVAIGLNSSYIFGTLEKNITSRMVESASGYSLETLKNSRVGGFKFRVGAQYYGHLDSAKNLGFTLGAFVENPGKIRTNNTITNRIRYTTTIFDTISHDEDDAGISYPFTIGLGFSMNYQNKILGGFDYINARWENTGLGEGNIQFVNSQSYIAGIQYTPNPDDLKSYLKQVNYRLGAHYTNSYLNIDGNQLTDYGMSFGLGFPIWVDKLLYFNRKNKTMVNLSCELGQRGTINDNLIKESYAIWSVSLTLYDFWFYKSKYD